MVTFYHHLFPENQKSHIPPRFRKRRRYHHSRTDFEEYRNIYDENVFARARFSRQHSPSPIGFSHHETFKKRAIAIFSSIFSKTTRRDMREKTGRSDVIQKNEIYATKSTPYLNGANGKAFDTDAFAVLTDFVNVGRAVETALEDAWMANIFFYFFVRV